MSNRDKKGLAINRNARNKIAEMRNKNKFESKNGSKKKERKKTKAKKTESDKTREKSGVCTDCTSLLLKYSKLNSKKVPTIVKQAKLINKTYNLMKKKIGKNCPLLNPRRVRDSTNKHKQIYFKT